MNKFILRSFDALDLLGVWLGLLSLRVLLGWDYWSPAWKNSTAPTGSPTSRSAFPSPVQCRAAGNQLRQMATWFELLGGVALVIGLATRFFTVSLLVLTVVAIAAVHWPGQLEQPGRTDAGLCVHRQGAGQFQTARVHGYAAAAAPARPGQTVARCLDRTALRRRCAGQASPTRCRRADDVSENTLIDDDFVAAVRRDMPGSRNCNCAMPRRPRMPVQEALLAALAGGRGLPGARR